MNEQNGEPPPIAYPVTPTDVTHATAVTVAKPVGPTMPRRGSALAGWLVVLAVVGGIIYVQNTRPLSAKVAVEGDEKVAEKADAPIDSSLLAITEIQCRFILGTSQAMLESEQNPKADEAAKKAAAEAREKLATQVAGFDQGPVFVRIRAIITMGEVDGPKKAVEALDELTKLLENHPSANTPNVARMVEILSKLYQDYADGRPDAPTVDREERAVVSRLGWFGDLALGNARSEEEDAKLRRQRALEGAGRTFQTVMFVFFIVGGAFVVGIITLMALTIVWLARRTSDHPMTSGLGPPVPHHAIYVETFAAWLTLYIASSFGMRYLPGGLLSPMAFMCLAISLPIVTALCSLFWPVLRGVPAMQVLHDIGLTWGKQPLLEPTIGILVFGMELPFVIVGAMCSLALIFGQTYLTGIRAAGLPGVGPAGDGADPFGSGISMAHPAVGVLAYGSMTDAILLLSLGCILAPFCEEILFRGVLYRHVRDATRRLGTVGFLLSALIVNLTFAAIHPQGLFAVPALMSLAFAFTLGREWRGTLIPSMIAHAVNNSLIFAAVYQATH